MKTLCIALGLACLLAGCTSIRNQDSFREPTMITHSVFFKLKHEQGSEAEAAFIVKAKELANIPGVGNFQVLEETSPKNDFDFGLSMVFLDQAAYDSYNNHPDHVSFVQNVWLKEVADFQEIDYVAYNN